MTQRERIIRYLKDNGSITALEAVKELGVLQLSARLVELENEGYIFDKKRESSQNRYGERVDYIRYSLVESEVTEWVG